MDNWNIDKSQLKAKQDALKKQYEFAYIGHGTKATGFMAKTFKRKPGLFVRCIQCSYFMPLDAKGEESCICGSLIRNDKDLKCDFGANEVEVFKGIKRG